MLLVCFLNEHKEKLGLYAQNKAPKPQPLAVLFSLLANEARLHERLAYVVRVDNRASVEHVAVTPAV